MALMHHDRSEEKNVLGFEHQFAAQPVDDPWTEMPREILVWCRRQFGRGIPVDFTGEYARNTLSFSCCDFRSFTGKFRWAIGHESVYIRDEQDAIDFKMRWC